MEDVAIVTSRKPWGIAKIDAMKGKNCKENELKFPMRN